MDSEHRDKFARLLALSKIHEARVKANPLPFLNELAAQIHNLRTAVDEAMYELSGASSFDIARDEFPIAPPSIVETATIRNRKAHDILAKAIANLQQEP